MPVSHRLRRMGIVLASLLVAANGLIGRPAMAAEQLVIRLEKLEIPISLDELEGWIRKPKGSLWLGTDVGAWVGLLDSASRRDLITLLRAPMLRDRSFGRQLLDSWAGGQLLMELGRLLSTADGRSSQVLIQETLRNLLRQNREVSAIELLRAIPEPRLNLQLDGLVELAEQWRYQLRQQRRGLRGLRELPLPIHAGPVVEPPAMVAGTAEPGPSRRFLVVPQHSERLPIDLWTPPQHGERRARPWVLMMPGLGGSAEQLGWLAGALARRGWPVVVLQHPGSDARALKAALDGQRPPPGSESLAARVADVQAVLQAQRQGTLPVRGDGVVLVGHSLGGVSALLAAGLAPEAGLDGRCRRALRRLPFTNPSRLLQCQLSSHGLPRSAGRPAGLRGVITYNGFGSLLWPERGVTPLGVPVMMVGGSLDLVTPPLVEQLGLFLPPGAAGSRLVLVEGGSHFSPVRLSGHEEALFRLGDDLVGVDPLAVQQVLLQLTDEFLETLESAKGTGHGPPLPSQRRLQAGVTAYVLDPSAADRWQKLVR